MTDHDMDIVTEILHRLKSQLGEQVFCTWFQEKVRLTFHQKTLYLDSYIPYVTQWNRRSYKNKIREIASELAECSVEIIFRTITEADFLKSQLQTEDFLNQNAQKTKKKRSPLSGCTLHKNSSKADTVSEKKQNIICPSTKKSLKNGAEQQALLFEMELSSPDTEDNFPECHSAQKLKVQKKVPKKVAASTKKVP
ncbi:MAG: hypothetical protein Q4C96_06285, partial [Planctomycetia bacterium]|nr:hypothetical protein [Planctomycetia bacterium]